MKFETYAHKIVVYNLPNFHKDPCKDACARGVNTRARISSRVKKRDNCTLETKGQSVFLIDYLQVSL